MLICWCPFLLQNPHPQLWAGASRHRFHITDSLQKVEFAGLIDIISARCAGWTCCRKLTGTCQFFFQIFSNLWCPVTIMSARCFCSSCLERSQDDYGNMSRPGQVQPLGNHSEQVKYVHKNYEKPAGSTKQAWNPEKGKLTAVLSMAVAWETKDARKLS